ncbi:MAG: hypothetical protein IIZ33_05130, partial [Erysipelotrichaceae bacterium]|nr:hypothetical protein [Erysipelotrichaceae bacterium]
MILIRNIKLRLEEEESQLKEKVKKKYRIREKDILSFSIYKRSVDARKEVSFIYSVLLSLKEEEKLLRYPDVSVYEEKDLSARKVSSSMRPVIIGYGPSGIFAAWRLSEAGLKPVILERGKRIQEREKDVESFFKGGPF